MFGFVTVATLAGFLASVLLRWVGVQNMAIRYPLAVAGAYSAFLGALSLFVAAHRNRLRHLAVNHERVSLGEHVVDAMDPPLLVSGGAETPARLAEAPLETTSSQGSKGSGILSLGDGDALVLIVLGLILLAIVTAVYASVLVVIEAPILLAEVLADGVLLAGLSRRFRHCDVEHWTSGVVQRTWKSALIVALAFATVGLALQLLVSDSTTMSEALWTALQRRGSG